MLAVVALAACGGEPAFEERAVGEVQRALESAGLTLCGVEQAPADELAANATAQTTFSVGLDCDDVAVVQVVAWPDRGARDEAIRRFEAQSRPSSQSHGLQLAFGQFTIDVSGARDEQASDRAVEALTELGAG